MNKGKTLLAALAVLPLVLTAAIPVPAAANDKDFKIIQRAVNRDQARAASGEIKWLKVLITDRGSSGGAFKLTLPVVLVETILACTDGRHFKVDEGDCEIDLKGVWKALKKAGPLALVEIEGDDGTIKIWLE